ncbi:MAG: hypothetical protein JWQ34_2276 [Mucilaginibacter sp.]|nr:hypothetical protein [Mucilaginibacter sp.]
MKKLPLVFCLLFGACAAPKQIVNNNTSFHNHPAPYHVFSVGKWNNDYIILTLIDAQNTYFNIKTNYNALLKRGDVYKP